MGHQPNNISAGTQVVALKEVRGTNNSLVHPRGAVGIVTRTPTIDGEPFLVRFPDGFELGFERNQIEILKHFKDRLGVAADVSRLTSNDVPEEAESQSRLTPAATFELEDHVILRCVVGSRAYGLDTDESDTDYRGVYLAPPEMLWSLYGAPEQFEDHESQTVYWELQKFLVMALKANPNILECLYSPIVEKVTEQGEALLAIREHLLSQMVFQTFNGYALSQFKKIEQDLRNSGKIKWKHAMHLLRLLITGAETLRTGSVPVRVEQHRDKLLAVKRGEFEWREMDTWRKQLHSEFETALTRTELPERPNYEMANRFLINSRRPSSNHE